MDATRNLHIETSSCGRDTYLVGECSTNGCDWCQSRIRLDDCLGDFGGRFQWGGHDFTEDAKNIHFNPEEGGSRVPVLRADLRDSVGRYLPNKDVNLAERINNVNGRLEFH
ncbi:Cyanovirin-N [Aspergillus leporis]|uniref:Cyanovirin-N n=1 Tax=Aspergillus leporis TaxID=41062 RepID=A0A5N5WK10_9EURO|nr:Cyanovirin-N [Aspergillus leporis]